MDKDQFKKLVKTSAKEHPAREHAQEYVLVGYWEKKAEGENKKSWVGRVSGIEIKEGKEALKLDFGTKEKPVCFVKREWISEKGDSHQKAMFKWHLKDGIYVACIYDAQESEKPHYLRFAVCDGERTDLSEEAALSILQEGVE